MPLSKSPFLRPRLAKVRLDRLEDPEEWRRIPILDKDTLRALTDQQFYSEFCIPASEGVQEYWRSGGVTGQPLFYPRSFRDMEYGLEAFARTYDCAGAGKGDRAHISFPLGIHPVGQVFARCAASRARRSGRSGPGKDEGTTAPRRIRTWLRRRGRRAHRPQAAERPPAPTRAGSAAAR